MAPFKSSLPMIGSSRYSENDMSEVQNTSSLSHNITKGVKTAFSSENEFLSVFVRLMFLVAPWKSTLSVIGYLWYSDM